MENGRAAAGRRFLSSTSVAGSIEVVELVDGRPDPGAIGRRPPAIEAR